MIVLDLIRLLEQQDPSATVVLWDPTGRPQPAIRKLGYGEVQPLQIASMESNGLLILAPWTDGDKRLNGPHLGVLLGSALGEIGVLAPPEAVTKAAEGWRESLRQRSGEYLAAAESEHMSASGRVSSAYHAAYFACLSAFSQLELHGVVDHPNADIAAVGAKRLGLGERACAFAEQVARDYYAPNREQLVSLDECLALAHNARLAVGWEDHRESNGLDDDSQ
jgi:hypothetical protein